MTVEQGRNSRRIRFGIAARKKLMSERLTLTLRVIDVQYFARAQPDD